jgi:DNA polymerase-1
MERVGIGVDGAVLREMSKEIGIILDDLVARIHAAAGTEFNVASPKQLADILFTRLGLPVLRKTKTGPSTDEEVLTALAAMHEVPSLLLSHRQLAKLRNTYVDVLPGLIAADGRIHTSFNQAATSTGRLSSSNPNLQNIPVRTEWGNRIRRAFVPAPGWVFVSADYSQVELRILAHLSGDPVLREAFGNGEDIHTRTATALFGVEAGAVDKEMRRAAKTVNFGIIYGMSPFGLSRQLGIDQARAKAYIDSYFETYRGVRTYLDGLIAGAKRDGYVSTLLGRRRVLRELQSDKPQVVQFAERAALNTPIQGTAADMIKKAMIDLSRRLDAEGFEARLLVQIHDELLLEAPPAEVERVSALLRECMEGAVAFDVPILVDLATGPSWADLH